MRKTEKAEVIADIHNRFSRAKIAVLTDYRGLDVERMTDLRIRLRSTKAEYKVVKNTLAGKAAEGTAIEKLKEHLNGPVGIVLSYDDSFGVLKVLTEFAKKDERFKIKAGIVEDRVADMKEIKILSDLPPREMLLSKLLAGAKSPVYGLAGSLSGIMRKLIYALDSVKELKAKVG
ncbi:MAG: 50S ribosomal protein L10 [Nitrospirae bacterium]|nr:50S ribosomal protein L10 [Nitrospirota bacterium]